MLEFADREELEKYINDEIVTNIEAQEMLGVSLSALTSLVLRGKLRAIMERGRTRLFWRSDVMQRKEDAVVLREKYAPKGKAGE